MAIASPPPRGWDRQETQRRVANPLDRLRGSIRLYVAAEAVGVLLLYLVLWFWIGLLLDYGVFKAFAVDWVQELPRGVRAGVLVVLLAGLAAVVLTKAVLRLFREFRAPALALVLERRYPDLLGDRLITAVELADPALAERYGYSQAMVDQTVRDAAERVGQVSLRGVFDWRRLRRLGAWVLGLSVGLLVLVGAAYCAGWRETPGDFSRRFGDVAAIWFERNVLLADTIWPRRAHLELLDFPGDEIRVGRDAPPPALRVRAWKWVIADGDRARAPEGWRQLRWADLTPGLLGTAVPNVPADWREWTVDQVELRCEKRNEGGEPLPADLVLAVRDTLDRLGNLADQPSMSRRLRMLEIPDEVEVTYRGATTHNTQTMQQGVDHEYAGLVADLRESVRFTVRGADYYTPSRRIVVVPPPTVVRLALDEDQPAYLYHRPPIGGGAGDLRGRKHHFRDRQISLTGETSRVDVPAGTDVVLTAETDKPLSPVGVRAMHPQRKRAPAGVAAVPIEQVDDKTFRVRFEALRQTVDLVFEFTDTDGVVGRRHVVLRPTEDLPPDVDVQIEVMRKTNQGYLVSPLALVPFSGRVRDDRGLAAVSYVYSVARVDSPAELFGRVRRTAGTPVAAVGAPASGLAALGLVLPLLRPTASAEDERPTRQAPLATFDRLLRERGRADVSLEQFLKALDGPAPEPLLRDFTLEPEAETFSVEKLGLKVSDERAVQPHYRLRLGVAATDNNVETGPSTGVSKETFTVLVVSENELLAEIAKEEEALHVKLEEAVNRLRDGRTKLDNVAKELPELKPEEFSPMARRAEEVTEGAAKSWDATREVFTDYRRILRELRANQVQPGMITKVNDKICEPLESAINVEFVQADDALRSLQKALEAKSKDPQAAAAAREQMDRLIARLTQVLDAMADVTTINQIIKQLVEINQKEQEEYERLKALLKKQEDDILNNIGAGGDDGAKPKKDKK